jgi:hypothetical protein
MTDKKLDDLAGRLKSAGLSDEAIAVALRPVMEISAHTDMGSGHSDFPRHQDLHLDMPMKMSAPTDVAALGMSLELREGANEWVRIVNDRITQLEKRIEQLESKKTNP